MFNAGFGFSFFQSCINFSCVSESALRERKRIKIKSNQRSKTQEVPSPRSPEHMKKIASDLQLSADKVCNFGLVIGDSAQELIRKYK